MQIAEFVFPCVTYLCITKTVLVFKRQLFLKSEGVKGGQGGGESR